MNRKIILILALVLVFPCCQMAAQVQMVVMGGQYNDPHNENKPTHRVPPAPIYVNQEGRCLAFDSSLVGETIKVVSDETLLYTTLSYQEPEGMGFCKPVRFFQSLYAEHPG